MYYNARKAEYKLLRVKKTLWVDVGGCMKILSQDKKKNMNVLTKI